jgi:hypothetical protein
MFLISAGRRRKADVRKSQDSWWRDLCRIGFREELIDPLPSNRRGGSLSMLLPRGLVTKCSRVASCSGRMVCAGTLGTPINRRNRRVTDPLECCGAADTSIIQKLLLCW